MANTYLIIRYLVFRCLVYLNFNRTLLVHRYSINIIQEDSRFLLNESRVPSARKIVSHMNSDILPLEHPSSDDFLRNPLFISFAKVFQVKSCFVLSGEAW